MGEQCLKDKTVKGVGWSAADAFLGQGVTFIVGIILARLLSPEEYGLIGIVTIFTTILMGFVDCGFANALIRKKESSDVDYNSLFWVNLVTSIIMYAFLYFISPKIAVFFNRPVLVSLVRVTGLIIIIQSLSIVQNTILSVKIDFKTKTKASVVGALISGILGIAMAYGGCGVWSLVGQRLSNQLIYTLCLLVLTRWWPKLMFSSGSFKYMWGFGWKLMISGLIDRTWTQLYQAVVGKFYSPASLGQYTRAEQFASIFSSYLTSIVQRVSYPVLSHIQDDKERMIAAFRRIIKTTMFVTVIVMSFMAAISEPLIYCLIGPQWQQAASFLPLICIIMSFYPLHAINLNMLQVQGRTDIFLYLEIIKKILAVGPICLGIFVNIYWMLIGSVFLCIVCFFLNSYYTGRSLGYTPLMQLCDVALSYGVSVILALSVYFLKFLPLSNWIILPLQLGVGSVVIWIVCTLLKMPEFTEVKDMANVYIGRFLPKK